MVAPTEAELTALLLSAPSLVTLQLKFLDELTYKVIERAVVDHGFPKLDRFELSGVERSVATRMVDLLLQSNAPITKIRLPFDVDDEESDEDDDGERWREMALENNWELSIE